MPVAGEIIFLRVYDLGGTLDLRKVRTLLDNMIAVKPVQASRAVPEYINFAAPIPLDLSSLNISLTLENQPGTLSARLYEVGALAVTLRFPIKGDDVRDLARFNNPEIMLDGAPTRRLQISEQVVGIIKPRLKDALDEIFDTYVEPEYYTVFCLTEAPDGAEKIFVEHRAHIAGLLTGEPQPERLAAAEVEDTVRNRFSYYRDDLVVADWDAALLIEPTAQYEDLLYVFEVANLQLLALRKYDKYLDDTLDRGYEEYDELFKAPPLSSARARNMVRELAEVRMDLAKVTDEVANTAKFFGDWFAARVYVGLKGKLHIDDYHKIVEEKLATLNELYHSVLSEIDRRQNLALEVMIVLLIVFEVVMAMLSH